MADMSVHKDILRSREGHPQSYVDLIFELHSSSPIKAKVGHGCFPKCSSRVIWALNREQTHTTSPPGPPPKKSSFCASNRVANSSEETPRLREALQGRFLSAF